jgi:nucleoside phosphorylase
MKNALVIALKEEFDHYDLLTGVGPENVKTKFSLFVDQNPDLKTVINYGTCGSFYEKYHGLYNITTFSNTFDDEILGDGNGLKLISHDKFLTEKNDIDADLVDCEAYWLKKICETKNIDFYCFKYVSDYVGKNSINEFWDKVGDGKKTFDLIYRKKYANY